MICYSETAAGLAIIVDEVAVGLSGVSSHGTAGLTFLTATHHFTLWIVGLFRCPRHSEAPEYG